MQAGTGVVQTTTSAAQVALAGATIGNLIILQVLCDGNATIDSGGGVSGWDKLDGTDVTTDLPTNADNVVKDLLLASTFTMSLFIGRATTTSPFAFLLESGNVDWFARMYEFTNVNTGTTLAAVMEQNGTTTPATTSDTTITIADADVITTGADRLALNFVGVNDDNALDDFTGMTGGTWAEAVAEFTSATGTDAAIGLQSAAMASSGTIGGGTDGMAIADPWGVVGFALIGTTVATSDIPILVQARR